MTRRQRTNKRAIKDLTSSPESTDKASKKSRYSAHTVGKTDDSLVEVNWTSLVDEDDEEEEQAQLCHRERRSKKHHDDTTVAPSASTLPLDEDEIDLTAEALDLDRITRDTCKLPGVSTLTQGSDEDRDPLSACSKGQQSEKSSP